MSLHRIGPSVVVLSFIASASLVAQAAPGAADAGAPKAPPTPDSLRAVEERGRRLAQHDFVAWIATDSVHARRPDARAVSHYVVHAVTDSTWQATFGRMNATRDTFFVAYEVRQRDASPEVLDVHPVAPARPDTGYVLRAARAIELAVAEFGPQPCPYNASVLPRPDGDLWVYLVPAQTKPGVYPLGGDVRYRVASDGRRILATRRLHNAIVEFGPVPADGKIQASGHAAVLDDIPEDTDVFHVLVRRPRVPQYVVTREFLYGIQPDGTIRLFGRSREVLGTDSTP